MRIPFLKKIKVFQLVNDAYTNQPERKEVEMPMDELIVQMMSEQNALLVQINSQLEYMAKSLAHLQAQVTSPSDN